MQRTRMFLFSTVLALSGVTAHSALVTFEDITVPGTNVSGSSFTSGGFDFSQTAATSDTLFVYNNPSLCSGGCSFNGTQSLGVYNGDAGPYEVLMARVGGGSFTLNGFDFATFFAFVPDPAEVLTVIGTKAGGATVSQTFGYDSNPNDFQSAVSSSLFTNLESVLFRSANVYQSIDNISVSVPEPGTLALVGLSLGVAAVSLRRRPIKG